MTFFPHSVDDIDASWLGACLSEKFPGTQVTSLTRGTQIHGTATKIEYQLAYNAVGQAHGLPSSLWLKCGLETQIPEQAEHSTMEACFFRDVAPHLGINVPWPYGTAIAADRSSGIVLYEDLNARPVQFGKQIGSLSPKEMGDMIDMLAKMHAAYWKSPRMGDLGWLTPGGVIQSNGVLDRFIGFWDYASARPRFAHVPDSLRDRARMLAAQQAVLAADMAEPVCLVHGDPHIGNMFFDPDGKPGLLDWATVMQGHWAWDVSYAMIVNQTVDQRRALEKQQIERYLGQLAFHDVEPPPFASAWTDYSRHSVYMFGFVLCPAELQPEELCTQSAERVCAAIVDLDAFALLGL